MPRPTKKPPSDTSPKKASSSAASKPVGKTGADTSAPQVDTESPAAAA
jgi:hypothetical protein